MGMERPTLTPEEQDIIKRRKEANANLEKAHDPASYLGEALNVIFSKHGLTLMFNPSKIWDTQKKYDMTAEGIGEKKDELAQKIRESTASFTKAGKDLDAALAEYDKYRKEVGDETPDFEI